MKFPPGIAKAYQCYSKNYDYYNAKFGWDDGGEVDTTMFNPFFMELFAPALENFSNAYDIVIRPQALALEPKEAETGPLVYASRYIHGIPLRLPMEFIRKIDVEGYGKACEYLAYLACGPADTDSLCTIRLVCFENEPDRFFRILPSINPTKSKPRDQVNLAKTSVKTMYLLAPLLSVHTPRKLQSVDDTPRGRTRIVDWSNLSEVLPEHDVWVYSSGNLISGAEGKVTSTEFEHDVYVVAVNSSGSVRDGFILWANYSTWPSPKTEAYMEKISEDRFPKLVKAMEQGRLATEYGQKAFDEVRDWVMSKQRALGHSLMPMVKLSGGVIAVLSVSHEENGVLRARVVGVRGQVDSEGEDEDEEEDEGEDEEEDEEEDGADE